MSSLLQGEGVIIPAGLELVAAGFAAVPMQVLKSRQRENASLYAIWSRSSTYTVFVGGEKIMAHDVSLSELGDRCRNIQSRSLGKPCTTNASFAACFSSRLTG
jgi:hypothetical protein